MLFDPKWGKPTLEDFIRWLETKPPDEHYNFLDREGSCLIGQYMAARGIAWEGAPKGIGSWANSSYNHVCNALFGSWHASVAANSPTTFGAALGRAKAFLEVS